MFKYKVDKFDVEIQFDIEVQTELNPAKFKWSVTQLKTYLVMYIYLLFTIIIKLLLNCFLKAGNFHSRFKIPSKPHHRNIGLSNGPVLGASIK